MVCNIWFASSPNHLQQTRTWNKKRLTFAHVREFWCVRLALIKCVHAQPSSLPSKIFPRVLKAGNIAFALWVEGFIKWCPLLSPLILQSIFIFPPFPMGSYFNVHLLFEWASAQCCLNVIYTSRSIFHTAFICIIAWLLYSSFISTSKWLSVEYYILNFYE